MNKLAASADSHAGDRMASPCSSIVLQTIHRSCFFDADMHDKIDLRCEQIASVDVLPRMIEGEKTSDDKLRYSPPKSDLKSVVIACTILTLFFSCWYHALFQINVFTSAWWDILGTFILLEFLYTGVFITSHDAMHGAVAPRVSSSCSDSRCRLIWQRR